MRRYLVAAGVAAVVAIALFWGAARMHKTESVASAPPEAKDAAATPRVRAAWAPQIARTGTLSLFVDDPQKAANAVTLLAYRYGGQILSLELGSGGGNLPSSARMELRVPAGRYESAVTAIAGVGKVRERSESAQDLTGDISDSDARLENLRRTESDMRKIMDRSGSVEQILDVENQLSQVREQIQTLESSMKTMRNQVTYSTIEVSLQTEAGGIVVDAAPASQIAAAWQNAVRALTQTTVALASAIVWLAVFAPYALIVAAIGGALWRRRARA